ncbi:Acyl-CoA-binding protein [Hibiscus syriacus]|uniref:Acyl-CoA-binding protein n=1 Tax=Hibiscus syriacus TaxID=106335 RepID=A0A6A3C7U9_HIBSY|nr:Acyl-CoA-binding protein [Hibiscus syriacus]
MGLKEEFEEHAEKVKTLPKAPSNDDMLILYGHFKQATVGPVNTRKSQEDAMGDYITKVKQLLEAAGMAS